MKIPTSALIVFVCLNYNGQQIQVNKVENKFEELASCYITLNYPESDREAVRLDTTKMHFIYILTSQSFNVISSNDPTQAQLCQIDFSNILRQRLINERITITDPSTGIQLELISWNELDALTGNNRRKKLTKKI